MGRSNMKHSKPQRARVTSKGHARTVEILVLDENCTPRPVTVERSVPRRARVSRRSVGMVVIEPLFELDESAFVPGSAGLSEEILRVEAML